jgi:hypothetical protein
MREIPKPLLTHPLYARVMWACQTLKAYRCVDVTRLLLQEKLMGHGDARKVSNYVCRVRRDGYAYRVVSGLYQFCEGGGGIAPVSEELRKLL